MSEYEALLQRVKELEARLERHEQRTEGMSADQMMAAAKQWMADNRQAWRYIIQYAEKCVALKRRFSIQKACEELRDSHLVQDWEDFKINNSIAAVLTRYAMQEVPNLAKYVVIRRSKVDKFFPEIVEAYFNKVA